MALSNRILSLLLSVLVLSPLAQAQSQEYRFDEEELPTEAVTPKLDTPKAVLNRKLTYKGRFQADLGAGWLLDEAFYNNQFIFVQASFGFDEAAGAGARFLNFGSGLSDYSEQFSQPVPKANFGQAPGPKTGLIGFYERRMMYGKLSFGKHRVITAYLIWNGELGMISYGGKSLPLGGFAIANRFFPTQNLGLTMGLRGYFRQLVDPLSQNLRNGVTYDQGDFKTTTKISTVLDFSLTYLF